MKHRLIFLDIDGVLTSFAAGDGLDPKCLALLDQLVQSTCADLVLISAWRDRFGLDGVRERLAAAGLRSHLAAAVPALATGSRSDEIRAFLSRHRGPRSLMILDDVPLEQDLRDRQVVVDSFAGLQEADIVKAECLLSFRH